MSKNKSKFLPKRDNFQFEKKKKKRKKDGRSIKTITGCKWSSSKRNEFNKKETFLSLSNSHKLQLQTLAEFLLLFLLVILLVTHFISLSFSSILEISTASQISVVEVRHQNSFKKLFSAQNKTISFYVKFSINIHFIDFRI